MVQTYAYDAYGNPLGFDPATAQTNRLYNGEQYMLTAANSNFRGRPYDTWSGRFIGLDQFYGDPSNPLAAR